MSAPFGGGPLRIITADERLREARGIKGVLTGTSGIGKTTQLLTLDPQRTLFLNLEAGELAVQGWPGDEIRIRDWEVARDLAAWIGGANRRERMAPISHLVIDECHRSAAQSYQSIIDEARALNPEIKLLGLSATPGRGDGRSLRRTFSNVGYHLKIGTLISRGLLVPPRTYTIDLGVEDELAGLGATAGDFDMRAADKVLNRSVLNEAVVEHWQAKAADRRTIFFCATVDHADAVAEAFRTAGVTAETISGEMPSRTRADHIARFDRGEVQVLTNCMVLTEGFDSQPVGCIGILRPMLHKGTFIQAVGRGLRRVDPARFPGIVKTDCVVLDFAGAALRHGSLEQEITLDEDDPEPGQAPWKLCPTCEAELPLGASVCDFCGHVFTRERAEARLLTAFDMMEIDLLERSPFAWCDLHGDGQAMMASGFNGWAGVFHDGALWHALGQPSRDDQPDLLSDLSDLDFVRHLLADLHDDLPGKVGRFRMLTDLGGQMGRSGTMIFGGHAAYHAWVEARSSFVHGNYVATILLCQGLVEHLLAAYLHAGLMVDDIADRIQFADTLRRCREREAISDEDVTDLRRMMALRNPLSHFRHVDDGSNLDRRSIDESKSADDLLRHDAIFSIGLAVRMLSRPAFRLG